MKITLKHVTIVTLFMMAMSINGQEEDYGNHYSFVPGKNIAHIIQTFYPEFLKHFLECIM